MFLLSAFLVGFLGSFHCAGMCGPIALALPARQYSKSSAWWGRMLYNAGRIVTYSVLGLLAGLIGHRLAMAGFQKSLSVGSGILIMVIAIVTLAYPKMSYLVPVVSGYTQKIKSLFRKLFGKKSQITLFLIGTVNGLLPCGFVYLALAAAISSGSFLQSAGYMTMFGMGTLPMMVSISFAGKFLGTRFQTMFRKISPYVATVVAMFLIYRGINMTDHNCCHH